MATPYVARLSSELNDIKWSLCQLHMRSSYTGFGTGSLNRDLEDLCDAVRYLNASGKQRVVLMGHSTGSQNSIHYVLSRARAEAAPAINGVIVRVSLLGPAHDLASSPGQ
jgi:acetyl esterase/lipase